MNRPATSVQRGLPERLREYALLMRMDRPIGSLLLLWPTLWALWIAGDGSPNVFVTLVFLIGVFVMRSAGCVINDVADRDFDPHVERTENRPLAAGRVTTREALARREPVRVRPEPRHGRDRGGQRAGRTRAARVVGQGPLQ